MADVVPFDAGEPFDIQKLNTLVNAVSELQKSSLSSSGVAVKYIPQIWSGTIKVKEAVGKAGNILELPVAFPDTVMFDGSPRVVVTPHYSTKGNGLVHWYVQDTTQKGFTIEYTTTTPLEKATGIYFEYVAIYMKENV